VTEAQQYIWDRVIPEPNTGCWIWQLVIDRDGYGRSYSIKRRTPLAHRVSYAAFHGEIPHGFEIDHLCRLRCCVNPDHLEAVTREANHLRSIPFAINALKKRCSSGHPLSGDNLSVGPTGRRFCRACWRVRTAAYKARKGATA
jgi:hypothetical protein